MYGKFALSSEMIQALSSQVGNDETSTLVEDVGTSMTVDDDGEGFITPPNSISKRDTTQVDEDSAYLYTIV